MENNLPLKYFIYFIILRGVFQWHFVNKFKSGKDLYQIWVEDAESIEAKCKLLDKHKLAGAAFWKLGQETRDIWDTIIKYIN